VAGVEAVGQGREGHRRAGVARARFLDGVDGQEADGVDGVADHARRVRPGCGAVCDDQAVPQLAVVDRHAHGASLRNDRYRLMRALVLLSWLSSGSSGASSSGTMRLASILPSSTPHWSKLFTFQIVPWVNTLCSYR